MPDYRADLANDLLESLDGNEERRFELLLGSVEEVGLNLDNPYGSESGFKTILHLALEEDDGLPYIEALLDHGAKAYFFNTKLGCAPIHIACQEGFLEAISLLIRKDPKNRADINVPNKYGLTAFHILLGKLMDLASLENKPIEARGANPLNNEQLEDEMDRILQCLTILAEQKDLRIDFDNAVRGLKEHKSNVLTVRKLSSMTPLQIICSFQTWNAKTVAPRIHILLENLVSILLDKGVDPNATAAKGALPGTVPGSTPGILLAATRGYYKVVEVFKRYYNTNFLLENKFKQTILHVVLKAGYYNKIIVHGDESGDGNVKTIYALFDSNNLIIQQQMRSIINRQDNQGNTALHYAKQYPDQEIVKFLLSYGAKIDVNPQKVVNINPRTLDEYFYETCVIPEGDDIDDEDFRIRINFRLFEKPAYDSGESLESTKDKANAWSLEMVETPPQKKDPKAQKEPPIASSPATGWVDTRRLEYFSDVDSLHPLLKHPVILAFIELELNSLKWRYRLDFIVYLVFVVILFMYLSNRYGLFTFQISNGAKAFTINGLGDISYYVLFLFICIIILTIREIWQIFKQKKRYFLSPENYMEWFVILLVILNIIPAESFRKLGSDDPDNTQRHIAALTLLIAFMQVYLLLVRVVPNTPIPVYINMFTTVLKTYTFILLSYMAFIMSFAYSFFLMFNGSTVASSATAGGTNGTTTDAPERDENFKNIGLSLVKTIVMFIGEMDYTDLIFDHWLGYFIFVLFAFLLIIVLMNILNGLAVSDIHKIQEEVDTYYHISIIETLASTSFVSLLAEEIVLFPNVRPEQPKILGIPIPGFKVLRAKGGKENDPEPKRDLYFSENTVKAAKELVAMKQQQNNLEGKVTLENLKDLALDLRRDQTQLRTKLTHLEESVKTILEIMVSRQPVLERLS